MARKSTGRRKAAPADELVLRGGDSPKMERAGKRDWSKAKEDVYVNTLAETCNFTRAAEAAGVSTSSAWKRRKTNAAFRASCREAIAAGYQRLELALLDRALNGSEKIVIRKDGSEERVREYPNAVALTLLRHHRERAAEAMEEPAVTDIEEVRERLFNKLQRLRTRIEAKDSVAVKFRSARELIRALATATPEEQRRIIWSMTPADLLALDADFESWAHRNQLPPPDNGWRNWLMMAGRGFGKTRAGAEWIEGLARSRPGVRIALIGATIDEARRVMVEGVSGVLSVAARNGSRVEWEPSLGRLTWRNGSEAQIFSGDNADGLRGPEHDFAWVFTFEVESDPSPPTITAILADASGGKIAASDQRNVVGYAAYGDAIQPAVQPFVDHFGIQLFDDGQSLRAPTSASFDCLDTELGCSADLQPQPRAERSQVAARSLPTALTVEYYDPARDFQAAQSRASIPSALAKTASEQLPAALDCGFARALTETALARQWAERDTLRLRLPPPYLTLEPGMFLKRPNDTAYWTVSRTETDGMAVIADLHSRYGSFESMASDPGRVLSSPDVEVQPTQLAILELPDIDGTAGDAPQLSIAASSAAGAWKPVAVQIDTSGISQISQTAALPTILGVADTVLGDGQSILFDERSSVDVQLTSHEHWLQSCDDDALVNGGNLAAVGTELIQFGKVETLGAGKFRLSRLLRGRRGTEWAMGTHGAGETFAMIDPTRLQPVPVPVSAIGSDLSATALGLGDDAAVPVVHTVSGEALKPPSPVHLTAEFDSAGNLNCSWCRRSRSGWAWIDNVDAPLGCSSELYTVQLQGSASRLELQTNVASATFRAADITTIGSGMVLNVTQVGDFAVSRPATIQINS